MILPPNLSVILDACVLYPAPVRDILLNLAFEELFVPKWSQTIQNEWTRNLLLNRPDLRKEQLKRTENAMNNAFPNALVDSFEDIIDSIKLPDIDDRHVVAAAIQCNADIIVTFNLKDFPPKELDKVNIQVQHPDNFIAMLYLLDKSATKQAFKNQLASLTPP